MPTTELFIVVALTVGATFFVVVVAIGLILNKFIELKQMRSRQNLYKFYASMLADLLLQPVEEPRGRRKSRLFDHYEKLLQPVKSGLSWSSIRRRQMHQEAVRQVLIDFAKDLTGESLERLQYFFYSLGFVDESIALLQDRRWWIRAQAARDLGLIRARRATAALTIALEDDSEDVRTLAMQSLAVLVGVEGLGTILKGMRNLSRWAALELSVIVREYEEKSVPFLIEALTFRDQSVVLFSIEMLAEIGFVTAVEPLLEMARRYPNVIVRAKALEALGRLGDARSEGVLREALVNPYPLLRSAAVRGLERIGSPASVPLLRERIWNGPIDERISAARAMAKSGKAGLNELHALESGTDGVVTGIAGQVLEELGEGARG